MEECPRQGEEDTLSESADAVATAAASVAVAAAVQEPGVEEVEGLAVAAEEVTTP